MNKRRLLSYVGLIGLLSLTVFAVRTVFQPLQVTFLDVGQGDSILIETPEGLVVLIDTGKDNTVVRRLGEELPFFEKTIDLFVLTHPDLDHYGGILDVFQNYRVKRVALTGIDVSTRYYSEMIDAMNAQGIEWWFLSADRDLLISRTFALDVLYPFKDQLLLGQQVHNKNDTSISMRLMHWQDDYWEPLITLTGDGEADLERALLMSGQSLKAPLFKAGHHGSRTSNTPAFLKAVDPTTVVISAGFENPFGHPHPDVMERLEFLTVKQTMHDGSIRLTF